MSNFLAVATVTATLSHLLQTAVGADVPGATVTTLRPDKVADDASASINIFLYQVTANAAWRNEDLPMRHSTGSLAQRPRAAMDLHYLLTFHGDENLLQPQQLLGSAVRALHARPLLTAQMIQNTLADSRFGFLAASNLADEVERVKFTSSTISLEELSRLWATFPQTPYSLSLTYQGAVVLIETEETPPAALPVRERGLFVLPFRQPVIERIVPQDGLPQIIAAGSTLLIQGRHLRGENVRVRLGEVEVSPEEAGDTQMTLPLTTPPFPAGSLRAGVQGLQVIHPLLMGTPPTPHRGVESNVAALVLQPTILPTISGTEIILSVAPPVGREQRVILLLNARSAGTPRAFRFEVPPRAVDADSLTIPINEVGAGEYFVRLQVDGAESPLDFDAASPTFGPLVTIP